MSMPVAGPGALSQRTDRQAINVPTGLPYGQAEAMHQQEQAAPMAKDPSVSAAAVQAALGPSDPGQAGPQPPPTLDQGSMFPDEPVTHGADAGPGADSSILTAQPGAPTGGAISQAIAQAAASDTSGVLQQLLIAAQQRGV